MFVIFTTYISKAWKETLAPPKKIGLIKMCILNDDKSTRNPQMDPQMC